MRQISKIRSCIVVAFSLLSYTACIEPPSSSHRDPVDMAPPLDQATMPDLDNVSTPDMGPDMSTAPDMLIIEPDMPEEEEDMSSSPDGDMEAMCVPRDDGGVVVICEAAGLEKMRTDSDGHFALGADIVLPLDWVPIPEFSGVFDGRHHTIGGIELERSVPEEDECLSTAALYSGGFIDVMSEGTIKNVFIDGVTGGKSGSSLPTNIPAQSPMESCLLHYGGLIGLLGTKDGEVSSNTPKLENVFVTNIEVYVSQNFGGVVSRAGGGEFENVHVIGDQNSNRIFVREFFVGGLANQLEQATTLNSVSVQASIEHEGTDTFIGMGLLAARATNVTLTNVVARGKIESNRSNTPSKIQIGGLIGQVFLRQPEQFKLSECAVEPFDSDPDMIETKASAVGGLIGKIKINDVPDEDDVSYVTIKGCRVGRISRSAPRTGISGERDTGALVGELENSTEAELILDDIVIEASLSPGAAGVCHLAKNSILAENAPVITTDDVFPSDEDGMNSNGDVICSGIDVFDGEPLPAGWVVQDGEYERSALAEMFGPLRDQRQP